MKKSILKLTLLLSTIIVLTNCKKFGKEHDTYFYTGVDNTTGPLTLFIDGKDRGQLPTLKVIISPSNDTIIKNALHLTLNSGKYKFEAKDSQGNLKCSGTLKFKSNSLSGSSTMGSQETSSSGKVVVTKLSY